MGKHGKKQSQNHRRGKRTSYTLEDNEGEIHECPPNSSSREVATSDSDQEEQKTQENDKGSEYKIAEIDSNLPSKFSLYQQSVQSPKGDISYLLKFFMLYVGGRVPLHLQEDFCGTALLSVEWLYGDARRTSVGIDLDDEALNWCMENNVNRIGTDVRSRISLFHGNVLQPHESKMLYFDSDEAMQNMTLKDNEDNSTAPPKRDIVCAFNYSCCCLHNRKDLILYFKHALNALSKESGIFVMDLYGGTSSEGSLKMRRKFPNFTYIWEQDEFDIIQRKTRISIHYNLHNPHQKLRRAFSYSWRLWSLPEIKDCLEEAGFSSVHFWICSMPNSEEIRCMDGLLVGRDLKYVKASSFEQQDSWNAYIVGVA